MMGEQDVSLYVQDILDNANAAMEFVEGLSREDLDSDLRTSYAVTGALEIVGEAAKGVPDDVRASSPHVPWRKMTGMRDRLIHAYEAVDLDVVWTTVTEEIPPLLPELERLLESLRSTPD